MGVCSTLLNEVCLFLLFLQQIFKAEECCRGGTSKEPLLEQTKLCRQTQVTYLNISHFQMIEFYKLKLTWYNDSVQSSVVFKHNVEIALKIPIPVACVKRRTVICFLLCHYLPQ